jgi:hypothetical protein
MNTEAKEAPAKHSKDFVWVFLCWLGVAVMLYGLSSGPYMLMCENQVIRTSTPSSKFFDNLYLPLRSAYMNTPFWKPLGVYWHLWNPNDFDRAGKIHNAGVGSHY